MAAPKEISFLIVDDYSSIRKMIIAHLKELGFKGRKTEFEGPTKALEWLATEKVDFILSDWQMPDMSGLDFLKNVKKIDGFTDVPFMLVTTVNEKANVIEAISNGASNYIIKPWTKDGLLEKLDQCWDKHN
ncbi:MAG: response regulator [Bacteriovoracaceae bacterium]|jgi:two-component system, chemotaxis family, chemotaxis protein CheY|nr:response regulator [Bacteriovoracaceae bacterium]